MRVELAAVFDDPMLRITELPPERRMGVVWISLSFFAAVALLAAWRIRRA